MVDWPFTGRDDELRHLQRLMTGAGRGAVIVGSPGAGRTRLALEGLRLADRSGLATLRATATRSTAPLPFGALAELLPVPDLLSGAGGPTGSGDGRPDPRRRAVAALVARAAGRRPVLLVDDAHLLDDLSAALVHEAAASGSAFALVTVRAGAPAPEPVRALWRDGVAERIDLAGLSVTAHERLLSAALGGPIDARAARDLADRARGNLALLAELVHDAVQDGTLADEDGVWRLRAPLAPSPHLVDLLGTRFDVGSLADRAVLELAAFGEPLDDATLRALTDPARVAALERRGLLTSHPDGGRIVLRLVHRVHREVLRADVSPARRRAIARALAQVRASQGGDVSGNP